MTGSALPVTRRGLAPGLPYGVLPLEAASGAAGGSLAGIVVVGTQWGDEGKGKVVDVLSRRAQSVIRFQGGNNAGHTLVIGGEKVVLHLLPSGVMRPGCVSVLGQGMVVDPAELLEEVAGLASRGLTLTPEKLWVSRHAHVVMPYHRAIDRLREQARGASKIGTTGRGIGPTYEDKAGRRGIRMGDLLEPSRLAAALNAVLPGKNRLILALGGEPIEADAVLAEYAELGRRLASFIGDVAGRLHEMVQRDATLLFEGAQGTYLDVDHGTYPFVTSSNTVAGAACAGSGVGPTFIDSVVGITKAYTTRVGAGPFPSEAEQPAESWLRKAGSEFGATTGRPRRCGWFDVPLVRRAVQLNGVTTVALTKLDVLSELDEIPVCVGYRNGEGGFPADLESAEPVYETLPGWKVPIGDCQAMEELPAEASAYVAFLEGQLGVPIGVVSVGPGREQTIGRGALFK